MVSAVAGSRRIEGNTGQSLSKFVRTRRHGTDEIQAGPHVITATGRFFTTDARFRPPGLLRSGRGDLAFAHNADVIGQCLRFLHVVNRLIRLVTHLA